MCSAFRTFQGWTALSDMDHDQRVLHSVPIPEALGYLLLRPLLSDVHDDDMCGIEVDQVFPVTERWHSLLLEAQSGIPDVRAGDSLTSRSMTAVAASDRRRLTYAFPRRAVP